MNRAFFEKILRKFERVFHSLDKLSTVFGDLSTDLTEKVENMTDLNSVKFSIRIKARNHFSNFQASSQYYRERHPVL